MRGLLPAALAFLLAACDDARDGGPHIGILNYGEHRQEQVDGFISGMEALGYIAGENVNYEIADAERRRSRLPEVAQALVDRRPDLLVVSGGLESDYIKPLAIERGIPVVVLYNNALVERGLIGSRAVAGWPVTGVDNLGAELSAKRLALLHDLVPEARRILVLYYPEIAPSRMGVERLRAAAPKLGLELDVRALASRAEIAATMQALQPGEVDAMITVPNAPIDDALVDVVLPEVERLNLPLMTHNRAMVLDGALAAYGPDPWEIGSQAARLADKVLKGIPAERIPFEVPKRVIYSVNREVLERRGIEPGELARNQINEYVDTRAR